MVQSAEAADLGGALLENPTLHVNHVAKLLQLARSHVSSELNSREAIRWLKLYFVQIFDTEKLGSLDGEGGDSATQAYRSWIRKQYAAFKDVAILTLSTPAPPSVQNSALLAVMECVRLERAGQLNEALLTEAIRTALTRRHTAPEVLELLTRKFGPFDDTKYYMFKTLRAVADEVLAGRCGCDAAHSDRGRQAGASEEKTLEAVTLACLDLLMALPTDFHDASDGGLTSWCGAAEEGLVTAAKATNESSAKRRKRQKGASAADAPQHRLWAGAANTRQAYSEAWLSVLRLTLPPDALRRVLVTLPRGVMPRLINPWLLSDFLTAVLDAGGFPGVLALNGIFTLVTQHGLEYPNFYAKLYSLLQPEIMLAKHRVRFLQLTDVFLSSRLVPAYSVAAFIKRFARIGMTAPPAGACVCIAFIHNLIYRHPACRVLLHNPQGASGEDVFDEFEEDPAKTRAVESSLWELSVLRAHYCPEVVAAVRMLDKDVTDRRKGSEFDTESVVAGSYGAMLQQHVDRRIKAVPVAFYAAPPPTLFESDTL